MTSAFLRQRPKTQAIFAVGPDSALGALAAVKKMGLKGKIFVATMDLSDAIVQGIEDGTVAFTIDQQPYLQGYIPVAILSYMKDHKTRDVAAAVAAFKENDKARARLAEYGLQPHYGARNIGSGPGVVDKSNVDKVEKYAGQYR